MGLFSSKKKIYVSSVLYNMAGPEEDRANYLKTTVIGAVLSGNRPQNQTISGVIQQAYIKGPGIKLRSFYNFVKKPENHDIIGMPTSGISGFADLDDITLAGEIPHAAGETVVLQRSEAGIADYTYWADQWIMANDPDKLNHEWDTDYNESTGEITISFEDMSSVTFIPTGFQKNAVYIYATYYKTIPTDVDSVVTGSVVTIGDSDPFPSNAGWTLDSNTSSSVAVTLHTTIEDTAVYSDGRPNEVSTSTSSVSGSYTEASRTYNKVEYLGQTPGTDSLTSRESWRYEHETAEIDSTITTVTDAPIDVGGGVSKTVTHKTTTESIDIIKTYRVDTQDTDLKTWSNTEIYIYRVGSGNSTLDSLVLAASADSSYYFPFIPCRLNNKYITESPYGPEVYAQSAKAYKKALGGVLNDLLLQIDDNESIGDIDYAYVAFGVAINVIENDCREYLYRYFKKLMDSQIGSGSDYAAWETLVGVYNNAKTIWQTWKDAQSNSSDPLYGTAEPSLPAYPAQPNSSVRIRSAGSLDTNFDMEITWGSITEETGIGISLAGMKKGEIKWEVGTSFNSNTPVYVKALVKNFVQVNDSCTLHWQYDDNSYRRLIIKGMTHKNYIYGGKFVETSMKEGIEDTDESAFLVPLHYATMREMGLVKYTQMATACCFSVFNCYKVVKIRWYQRGIFKILVIVAIIAIAVATGGIGGASAGILGTNAAVGAALGLSGLTAIIVGAIANALVAMIITKLIMLGATAIFGEKLGLIIGTIASFVALNVGQMFGPNGGLNFNWSELTKADNILKLTSAVGNVYSQYVGIRVGELQEKTEDLNEKYEQKKSEIEKLYADNIGYGNGIIDPVALLTGIGNDIEYETGDSFLSRTLMTGSEVADLSMSLLNNFAELNVTTDLAR